MACRRCHCVSLRLGYLSIHKRKRTQLLAAKVNPGITARDSTYEVLEGY
jgi:hypothetical protein